MFTFNHNISLDTSKKYCRILLDTMLAKGVRNIVVSPGSRNAPLLIGINSREEFNVIKCADERMAGFIALGLAMVKQEPVALCCTSGTALYNYAPAVAEAFYQNIPLVILSADRPIQWIDQDDSQTLIQPGALSKIVKKCFEIPEEVPGCDELDWYVNRTTNEAINLATHNRQGPVHINIRLDAPLAKLTSTENNRYVRKVEDINAISFNREVLKFYAEELVNKKVLIIAGFMPPNNKLNKLLHKLEGFQNVKILCETISNLHLNGNPYSIDRILRIAENSDEPSVIYEELRADVVISIGGALVSRKLKEFIRNYPPLELWTLADTSLQADCFKCQTKHFNLLPETFFSGIVGPLSKGLRKFSHSDAPVLYKEIWHKYEEISENIDNNFFSTKKTWSELSAYRYILNNIPSSYNLFLSNGTVIRYAQLFTKIIPHASYGNRGVSGIEGTNATALGTSMGYKGTTLLITGDLSFGYDTGILALKNYAPNLKIIVINNDGGGIFRFIPSTKDLECCESVFCAHPELPLEGLANAYKWKYLSVSDMTELPDVFKEFISYEKNIILELKFDAQISANHLLEYFTLS